MEGVWRVSGHYVPKHAKPPIGRAIAELAERQHGVISLRQLQALGMGASAVEKRVLRGALHRVHRGVYAVGHPLLTGHGRSMAAVLACGPRATLSHRSAAALWELRPVAARVVDVTAPGRAGRGDRESRFTARRRWHPMT